MIVDLTPAQQGALQLYAVKTKRTSEDLLAAWIAECFKRVEMFEMIDNFKSLTDAQKCELEAWAGDLAGSAQMLWMDARDGGYDWGLRSPPDLTDD